MKIRYGCEIAIDVQKCTPTVCMVELRPEFLASQHPGQFLVEPAQIIQPGNDVFGNRIRRFLAAPGINVLKCENVISVDGALDHRPSNAEVVPVEELPDSVLTFLNASTYCDVPKLAEYAWRAFGREKRDISLVESVCDFVHDHLRFDYR